MCSSDKNRFPEGLERLRGSRIVIMGVGNTLRSDDGAGPHVCRRLIESGIDADILDAGTVPENYIGRISNLAPDFLVLVDAVALESKPGTVLLIDGERAEDIAVASHAFSPDLFLEMIRRETEAEIVLVGICPAQTDYGEELSPEVKAAVGSVADALVGLFD